MESVALQISELEVGYLQGKRKPLHVAGPISNSMNNGELHCLLGPNGVGKSTLLRTLAGLQPPIKGQIHILDRDLKEISKKELAKMLSVVLTDRISSGSLSAYELISLGRIPHTGWLGNISQQDRQKIDWAIENTNIIHLVGKSIHELSDGERQKVMIARALAQDTPVILLDEPTAHLDLPNRVDIIRLLRNLARNTGKAIVMSTHELDLALQAADKIWLMTQEDKLYTGVPEDLVLHDIFGDVFTNDGIAFDKQHGIFKVVEPHCSDIGISGDKTGSFWTRRALERQGFTVVDRKDVDQVSVVYDREDWVWTYSGDKDALNYSSIADLLTRLKEGGNS